MRPVSLLIVAVFATAQPPQPEVVLRSTTRLVQVNVIATAKGQPVSDLTRDDFVLMDRGKRQEIRTFSIDRRDADPPKAAPLAANTFTNRLGARGAAPPDITIILLDSLNTKFKDLANARQQLLEYLAAIPPESHVGLYALGHRLRVLHEYTADASLLLKRLASFRGQPITDQAVTTAALDQETQEILTQILQEVSPKGRQLLTPGQMREQDFFLQDRILGTLRAIRFIADHVAQAPGRKSLIWLSAGFPLAIGYDGHLQMHPSVGYRTYAAELDDCMLAVNHANLAIYPVDSRGLAPIAGVDGGQRSVRPAGGRPPSRTEITAPDGGRTAQDTLQIVAARTGGRAYYNTNDLAQAIRDAVADARVTYTLGFYPADEKPDGKFHDLKVAVNRPGVALRYRNGYFSSAPPPQDTAARQKQMHDAVFNPLESTGLGLTVHVARDTKLTPEALGVVIEVDAGDLQLTERDSRWTGQVDMLILQLDADGNEITGIGETLNLNLQPDNFRKALANGLGIQRSMPRAPKTTGLRVLLRDAASGAIGSVSMPLDAVK